ncbi:MAG TPA: hypothetical protein VNO33_03930, partial [Kofleriaceae bacterium]|nr:hypothetical protein [Kofleriaceae bacterium]
MLRLRIIPCALLLACGSSATEPSGPAATAPAAAPTSSAPRAPANAEPDVPSGDAAARVAEYARRVEPVVYAFTNGSPILSPDGKKLLFATTRDGLPQLYVADAARPDSPATRITTPERVLGGESIDGKSIIFLSDVGADENWSIFKVGLDGKGMTELTPGEKLQRDWPQWGERKPNQLFFSARKLSSPETTVFALDLAAGGEPRPVYKDPVQGALVDVSPDGKLGLYQRFTRRTEITLVVVDLATGAARDLYPTSGQVGIWDGRFSADGKRVFLSTDGGGEESFVLALDSKTGKELARHAETSPKTAQVIGIEVSARGNLIAIAVDAGHQAHVRLLDARSLAVRRTLEMPAGNGALGEFSRDGKRLTLSWSIPERPGDAYVAATATGKVTLLRADPRPSLDKLPAVEVQTAEVKSFDGTVVPVNVYLPAGASGKRLPV